MAIIADIEDLAAAEFLLMLSLNRKSGRLTAVRGEHKVMVALHSGSIVYAASTAVRERVGSILVSRRLISEEQLLAAVAEQQRHPGLKHLGNILVHMGVITQLALVEVVQSQFQRVLEELLSWPEGVISFTRMEIPDLGAVRVDPREILLDMGFETEQLVLGSLSALEDSRRDQRERRVEKSEGSVAAPVSRTAGDQGAEGDRVVRSMMAEMESLTLALDAEMTVAILARAAEVVQRCVFLLVFPDFLSGAGGFGVASDVDSAEVVARRLTLPRSADSVFHRVVEEASTYRGPLAATVTNQQLVAQLGGVHPVQVVAVPMVVAGRVVAVLYGDNGGDQRPIPPLTSLEELLHETGRALEARRS